MLKIFIGYDPKEAAAYHTLCHSIIKRASAPVAIIPLVQSQLRAQGIYMRAIDTQAATEFSLTRFLVPYLSGYEGVSIFMDCDMVVKDDIVQMVRWENRQYHAVSVCKHDYVPKNAVKMDGQAQAAYPRKNWSSFMLFNNEFCKTLTPDYVNSASPADLHRFAWMSQDHLIGSLPLTWNWLVGEYPANDDAKILHYTEGGPWFWEYRDIDHSRDWIREHDELVPPPVWHKDSVRHFPTLDELKRSAA